ncbi:MAG: acetylxylan esterase [Bacteroidales bacterium]|nr:acetylxylan esterase [Bacteroidales bacterium]
MNRKHTFLLLAMAICVLLGVQASAVTALGQAPGQGQKPIQVITPIQSDTTRTLSTLFSPATSEKKAPDSKGFIQRWLVLEPIKKDIARNNIFTDNYLRNTIYSNNFSTDFLIVPKDGAKTKVGDRELKWYALDSKIFNFKLYRFAYAVNKPQNGVLFWLVTVINCEEEIKNLRLSAGCNSAGMFWLNGKEVLMLSGDRDMVVDNCTSSRLTLNKGKNIIRGAVINGPGMIDFCVRFIDEKGLPIKNYTISCE